MCITFAFFPGLVVVGNTRIPSAAALSHSSSLLSEQFIFRCTRKTDSPIKTCARVPKATSSRVGQCFALPAYRRLSLRDLAVEVAVAQKLAQGELFGFGCSLVVERLFLFIQGQERVGQDHETQAYGRQEKL